MPREWRDGLLILLGCVLVSVWAIQAQGAGFPGEQPTYARETGFEMRFFYVSGGNGDGQIEYICQAFPGTTGSDSTAASVWQVKRFTYDSSNRVSTIAFAGDDDAYTQICDNRTSLDYN